MIRQPPEHAADAVPLFIARFDDAIDHERIERETKELGKDEQHCAVRYWVGATRYDLDAPHTVGGRSVCMRDYIKPDAQPTVFHLRRVAGINQRLTTHALIVARENGRDQATDPDVIRQLYELTRHGLVKATEGFGGEPWDLQGGTGGLALTDDDLQKLFDAEARLPEAIGWAIYNASASLSEAEGKR